MEGLAQLAESPRRDISAMAFSHLMRTSGEGGREGGPFGSEMGARRALRCLLCADGCRSRASRLLARGRPIWADGRFLGVPLESESAGRLAHHGLGLVLISTQRHSSH